MSRPRPFLFVCDVRICMTEIGGVSDFNMNPVQQNLTGSPASQTLPFPLCMCVCVKVKLSYLICEFLP